ncbi:MAG: alcohol dehydrogenase catalytic domain-containing protein [Planctomycetes bacterium]|nr:alcohol dehydrogenase catalytic domain-containing protein [Planctomycetota bacterium]
MKTAVWYRNEDVRIEERPVPRPAPGEYLLRIEASGICGSDVMEWYRLPKAPLVLGHEIAGTVEATGKGLSGLAPGDRVVVTHHVPCNTCRACLGGHHSTCDTLRSTKLDPGGFCEFARVPALQADRGTLRIPDSVSFEDATFAEPLACVLHGLERARFRPGASVAVLGSGITGLLFVALARALGAGPVFATDVVPWRREAALRFGADAAIPADDDVPARLREANDGRGADLVAVCTAALPALRQGMEAAGRGATVLLFAPTEPGIEVPVPLWPLWRDDVTLTTAYAGAPRDLVTALDLIRARRLPVSGMITHRLPLDRAAEGFRLVAAGRESIKVVLFP